MQVYLSHPVWSSRITILIGSPMRRTDLARARAESAIACFIHTSRSGPDPETADQHTVISAWSVKNFAPDCKLYVHILKPETRMHLDLADQVMCEAEVKLALMANHVNCPGISTSSLSSYTPSKQSEITSSLHCHFPSHCMGVVGDGVIYTIITSSLPITMYGDNF
ncbi:Potassium channel subfamily T member 2 [Geodia barretti]|uniref:Potassium channel subfamily T member 2 n=1 Tax=Geodia barretti TaxID=519541 RepID=A0AA35W038_GEOBA|nr:Potassium channel subfamily T member 2 [Geodia barretti]